MRPCEGESNPARAQGLSRGSIPARRPAKTIDLAEASPAVRFIDQGSEKDCKTWRAAGREAPGTGTRGLTARGSPIFDSCGGPARGVS